MKRFIITLLALCMGVLTSLHAQDTEFWFAAPDDANSHGACDRPTFLMISTGIYSSTVEIYIGGTLRRTVNIPSNSFHRENFTSAADITLIENSIAANVAGTVQNKGIYIKASNPVTAYYQVNGSCSKDVFTLKGKRALGTHFFTPFQTRYGTRDVYTDAYNHFAIVATEDNTSVTIQTNTKPNPDAGTGAGSVVYRPAGQGGNVASGTAFTITLNKGQTYTVRENSLRVCAAGNNWWGMDKPTLSGTEVTATKPIAITVAEPGTTMASTNPSYPATDLLGDQIVPVDGLGTNYIVTPGFKSGTAEEWVYLTATEDNTTVTAHRSDGTTSSKTLNKGQHWPYQLGSEGVFFLADKPSYCYHQSAADHETGAAILPSMFAISSRSISFYKQSSPDVDNTYLFLIFRKGAEGGFTRNGATLTIPSASIHNIPSVSDWVYAKVTVSSAPEGLCVIENSQSAFAMGVFSYYTNTTTSYGFMSDFGYFSFGADTTYKCVGDPVTLDAGYASNYAWVLPDGSTANTSNVTSTQEGWYKVTVNQDTYTIIDSIYVKDRFGDINTEIVGARFRTPGETYKYHVDFHPEYISNVTYDWSVTNGSMTQITPDTIEVTWTDDGMVRLVLQDTLLGCRKELSMIVMRYPDNIVDVNCFITPPAQVWGISSSRTSLQTHSTYQIPIVGDIDGDGIVEILVAGGISLSPRVASQIYVYKGNNLSATPKVINTVSSFYWDNNTKYVIGKTQIGGKDTTLIVVAESDQYLRAYNHNGTLVWTGDAVLHPTATHSSMLISFADLNNDGIPEIITQGKVFNSVNGKQLCTTPYTTYTVAADVFNTGKLNLIVGNYIYEANSTLSALNLVTTINPNSHGNSEVPGGTTLNAGGFVSAVDMDGDGKLEVIISLISGENTFLYVADPRTGNILASKWVADAGTRSYPFVGDIDGDGFPEIVFIKNKNTNFGRGDGTSEIGGGGDAQYCQMLAFKYAPGDTKLQQFWSYQHYDYSGGTGMTLFDFNLDGIAEIVYRDEWNIRIINGSGKHHITGLATGPYNLASFGNHSGTSMEYPTVADVDGDGQAEILIVGAVSNNNAESTGYYEMSGPLWIFKSDDPATRPWAPARKVWNQYPYNATVINEDLTVPAYQLNPATIFPGDDGILGTADDVQPFNNFLQQQTTLNKNGTPLWLAAQAILIGSPRINYDVDADSMTITAEVYNGGDAAFQAPFYVTAYNGVVGGSPSYTHQHNQMIMAGDTATIMFGISNFKATWSPFNGFALQINDNGTGFNYQEVCDSTQRQYSTAVMASDDHFLVFTESTDNQLDILLNDILPTSCGSLTIQILSSPAYTGAATVNGSYIEYTPAAGFIGGDTLRYRVHCGDASKADTATVYINIVEKPDNIIDPDCWITPQRKDWEIQLYQQIGTVSTTANFVVGDMNEDGFPDIVAYGSDARNSIKIFWGPTFTSIKEITGLSTDGGGLAIGRVKVSDAPVDTYESFIFYRGASVLRAVRPDGTNPWTTTSNARYRGMIGLADFNGDGWTEVYSGNQIYDAATGKLLCDGGAAENSGTTFGITADVAHPTAINIVGDLNLELVAGNKIYKVDIDRSVSTPKSLTLFSSVTPPSGCPEDGSTVVADFDNDGQLEVLVRRREVDTGGNHKIFLYLWSPHTGTTTGTMLASTNDTHTYFGIPFVGDIDGDGFPEIVTLGSNGVYQTQTGFKARRYNKATGTLDLLWDNTHIDQSGATGMTLFDFNSDGISEIVYRDESYLRIINASGKSHVTGADTIGYYVINSFTSYSETSYEYPVVVDLYGNGSSAILVTSDLGGPRPSGYNGNATIDIYTSDPSTPWAPARKVWNQYGYNPVNVNEDLTIPKVPLNIATVFPGADGLLNTADDVRPYNNFLQQQTLLNKDGVPLFTAPDAVPVQSATSSVVIGDSVSITVGVSNQGDAAFGSPIYVTLYKESISTTNKIATGSYIGYINPGDTGYVTVSIPDITLFLPMVNIVVRVNDDGASFPYQPECDDTNDVITILNPAMSRMMKKNAKLEGVPHDGTYPNPVSVLYNENIEYTITATNANLSTGTVIIRDTLPPYLDIPPLFPPTDSPTITTVGSNPPRVALEWSFIGVNPMDTRSVTVTATPHQGCVSSQPMFINRAWVNVSDSIDVPTNYTYHQGACIGVATFSAGFGGTIYGATEQALDYKTTPRSGIVIVPDEGYRFAGWSHEDYVSLRSETIKAQNGIIHYDTLTIYGNVALHANFELEEYPVHYYLNGGKSLKENPSNYTVKSGAITLHTPEKTSDVFTGWTGSNGEIPQQYVTIGGGATGELEFYANFLYSGQEDVTASPDETKDKLWAAGNELYIRTSKAGSIVKIYSIDGTLQKQQTIVHAGETKIRLLQGIYIVTLDDDIGQKIRID